MKQTEKKESIVKYKLLYTVLILLVYLIGKSLPLFMIDYNAYIHKVIDAETLLMQTIQGDIYQCSLFALGISPYMISSMLVQVISAFRKSEHRSKISPTKTNKLALTITLILAMAMAALKVQELAFRVEGQLLMMAKIISVMEMVAGAMIIMWLCSRNKKYGIGGQSAIIFVNIIDGINATLQNYQMSQLVVPLAISLIVMMVVIFMENTEMRIPVQRISIHNIYADKNYLAIKLNPIGVMPAMFSTAFFMLPQMLLEGLTWLFPNQVQLLWLQENLSLTKPLGIGMYILILYILTIGFSRIFINPREITEQYLKSGDSLLNIHAGDDTKRYLSRVITCIGLLSATVMSVCLGVPLLLQLTGDMQSSLVTLPSSIMMMTGIWCNLYREVLSIKDLEAYEPFI